MSGTIRFLGKDEPITLTAENKSVLDYAIEARLPHLHECGGHGMCTTCRVRVLFGGENLSDPSEAEKTYREERQWTNDIRLACQAIPSGGDILVERLISSSAEINGLQVENVPVGIGEETELIVLFCDMRNFTTLSERQTNFDMAHILNRFFTVMGDAVLMNNGLIYQYAGDEIVALFGVGSEDKVQASQDAIRAAIGMTYAVERLNKWDLKHFDASIDIGVGLHFGRVFIGNVGHPQHKQFAVIGDSINITSRIQNKNRELGTRVLISKALLDVLPEQTVRLGKTSTVALKGKSEAFELFEVEGFETFDPNLEIQATIDLVLRDENLFAEKFYDRLFEKSDEVRGLFSQEMQQQGMLLTHMLRGIVHALSRPQHLVSGLRQLGSQHVDYGVTPEHYEIVREVLQELVEEQLGDEFTEYRRSAWYGTIDFILEEMRK